MIGGTTTRNQKAQIWLEAQWSLFGPGPMDVPMICWTYCWALGPNKPILPRHKKVPTQHLLLKLLKQNKRHSDQMNMLSIPIENFKTLATKLPPISINVSKKKVHQPTYPLSHLTQLNGMIKVSKFPTSWGTTHQTTQRHALQTFSHFCFCLGKNEKRI